VLDRPSSMLEPGGGITVFGSVGEAVCSGTVSYSRNDAGILIANLIAIFFRI